MKENEIAIVKEQMLRNASEAEMIYKAAIRLGLKNDQDFMDWQDRLNIVTFVHEEDL